MGATPLEREVAAGWRPWAIVPALWVAATLIAVGLDAEVSLTSQAMIYLLAVVVAAYTLSWVPAVICACGSVVALNFLFVPPRYTLAVEHHEHFIALATMLAVAVLINSLSSALRRQSEVARRNERRARHLQAVAVDLAAAASEPEVGAIGERALAAAFAGPCTLVLADDDGAPRGAADEHRDALRCCMTEAAVLGPGTARWPGLDAWYVPLGGSGRVVGAARVLPAVAADVESRDHAQALCALLAQAVWRLRLQSAMQAARVDAQRQQIQTTLLAAVSHDLRTPLATIVGAASSLRSQRMRLDESAQDRLLASIEHEADRLATLTENTLQLVRLSGDALTLRRDWESLEEIVGAVLARIRQRHPTRPIGSRVPAGLPLVRADAVLLAQLLENLLDNALKYSDGPVEIEISHDARELCVCVKDRGPGVAPEDAAHLFEPFVRGDAGHARRGVGLGLAVCRAIAQAHGARLDVRRRRSGGSSFRLALPVEKQPSQGAAT
ncbi:ATP-binding protein [Piscinibacter sp. XHJ-5]|uniref:ATP-binding protein n=1 Tax=Piscinibacter sp. XHJ-5 TaxID=3037797 RepID=UPI002452C126|nr:ATP-binding protein [Piscinibacter sp. XHJ-5]